MKTKELPKAQTKVRNLLSKISEDFYLCRPDITVGKESFNAALLFGVLTELNRGNQLLFGEYGGGKTTSAEYLNAIFNNLPLDLVKRVALRGNPQLTKEDTVGRPHYGELHRFKELTVWQHFVLIKPKIFDEFNRIPESNQSVVLNGVDRGEWNYMNDFIYTCRQPFFATCNYSDRGNHALIQAILDRFDVAVESKFPGVANSLHISQDYFNDNDQILRDSNLTREALKVLNSGKSFEDIQSELEGIREQQQTRLEGERLAGLTEEERKLIEAEVGKITLEKEAEQYLAFLIAELNVTPKYGQKRSNDLIDKDNGKYLHTAFTGSGSRREEKSIVRYSKALAWIQGQQTVSLDHIMQVSPYVLWHRLKWTDEIIGKLRNDKRDDPLDLYITKTLLGNGTPEFPGIQGRYIEGREAYQLVIDCIGHGDYKRAKAEATKFAAADKGHPVFTDLLRDLA